MAHFCGFAFCLRFDGMVRFASHVFKVFCCCCCVVASLLSQFFSLRDIPLFRSLGRPLIRRAPRHCSAKCKEVPNCFYIPERLDLVEAATPLWRFYSLNHNETTLNTTTSRAGRKEEKMMRDQAGGRWDSGSYRPVGRKGGLCSRQSARDFRRCMAAALLM